MEDTQMDENMIQEAEVVEPVVEKTAEQLEFERQEEERLKKAKIADVFDKIGNVCLVLLAIAPFAILGYIFWWFIAG
jgi:DNA-binding protein H-NS